MLRFEVHDLIGQGVAALFILHVSRSGEIGVLDLGQFHVAGLTEIEAEQAIAKAYAKAGILPTADVRLLRIAPDQVDRWRFDSGAIRLGF